MKIKIFQAQELVLLFLRSLGLDLVKCNKNPDVSESYIESLYKLRSCIFVGRYMNAFKISIDQCVSHNGFSFSNRGWHPFVNTLSRYLEQTESNYASSSLKTYYDNFQPRYALEPCIETSGISPEYRDLPAYAYVFPWDSHDPWRKADSIRRSQENENKKSGFSKIDIGQGCSHHGPVSDKKGTLEYARLINILNSIKTRGYIRHSGIDGDVMGTLLSRKGEYRFLVEMGFHRISSLSALGYKEIPVRLTTPIVVDKSHLQYWPQVKSGLWNHDDASYYFDQLFEFDSINWALQKNLRK